MSKNDDVTKRDTTKNKIKLPLQFGMSVLALRFKLFKMYNVEDGTKHTLTDIENKITEVVCHASSKYILRRYNRKKAPIGLIK